MKNKWLGYLILSPFILIGFVLMAVCDLFIDEWPTNDRA